MDYIQSAPACQARYEIEIITEERLPVAPQGLPPPPPGSGACPVTCGLPERGYVLIAGHGYPAALHDHDPGLRWLVRARHCSYAGVHHLAALRVFRPASPSLTRAGKGCRLPA